MVLRAGFPANLGGRSIEACLADSGLLSQTLSGAGCAEASAGSARILGVSTLLHLPRPGSTARSSYCDKVLLEGDACGGGTVNTAKLRPSFVDHADGAGGCSCPVT